MLSGWVGSEALERTLRPAPCGCEEIHKAATADERDREVLLTAGEEHRKAWRCPTLTGQWPEDTEGMHRAFAEALDRVHERTGARCTTCPKAYTKHDLVPWIGRAVRAYRLRDSPRLAMREPVMPAPLLEAVEVIESAVQAHEAYELKRLREKNESNG